MANPSRPITPAGQKSSGHSPRRWLVRPWTWVILCALPLCGFALAVWAIEGNLNAVNYGYEIVRRYPHDPRAYCQGLVYSQGTLYEGTGKYGGSSVRRVDLETGGIEQMVKLHASYFGEGITVWGDRIVQLTWRKKVGIVYDRESLEMKGRFRYGGEGWGLTHNGEHLIMSDGTETLRFLDPRTFRVVRRLSVRSNRRRIRKLNELEFVKGEIWANVWFEDYIVRISPDTGEVVGIIDLTGLLPARARRERDHVLNGIAYDADNDRLFVTGKNWPTLFEIRVLPR